MDTFGAWFSIYLALLFLPIATAGTVPADRQYGVFELLRSMPLDGRTYLAGKVLGGIGIVFFIACFPFLLLLAILEGIMLHFIGLGLPFELIAFYLKLTFMDSLPVLAGGAVLGVVAGVAFRSRRTALLPGLVAGILGILSWLLVFRSPPAAKVSHDILAYHVFQGYQSLGQAALARIYGPRVFQSFHFSLVGADAPPVGMASLVITYVAMLAVGAGLFGLARLCGAPVAVTALIGLLVGAGIAVAPFTNLSMWTINQNMTPEQVQNWTAFGVTVDEYVPFMRSAVGDTFVFSTMLAWLLIFLALLLLPMTTAMSIPADRKFGVSELLRSAPITGSGYLAGKFLGMLAAVLLVGGLMVALFFAIVEIILFSVLHFGLSAGVCLFLISLALLDGVPMLACATAVGVLVGTFFRTRRAAILPGMLAGGASLVCWANAFRAPAPGISIGMTDRIYYYLVQNYHSPAMDLMTRIYGHDPDLFGLAGTPPVSIGQIALMYLTLIAALAVLACLARLWLQWKENF
jgi:hypothetical protein